MVHLQHLFEKPLFIDIQSFHGVLVLSFRYLFSNVPCDELTEALVLEYRYAPSPLSHRVHIRLLMECRFVFRSEIIKDMVHAVTKRIDSNLRYVNKAKYSTINSVAFLYSRLSSSL